jgi:hypothetical protein
MAEATDLEIRAGSADPQTYFPWDSDGSASIRAFVREVL